MTELALVAEEELLKEVFNRFDSCVFSGAKYQTKNKHFYGKKYKGDPLVCIGMAAQLWHLISVRHNSELMDCSGDE